MAHVQDSPFVSHLQKLLSSSKQFDSVFLGTFSSIFRLSAASLRVVNSTAESHKRRRPLDQPIIWQVYTYYTGINHEINLARIAE